MSIGVTGGSGTLQNIEVLGGMYSGNNLGSGSDPYGVAVYGPASAVRVIGVSCVGGYEFIQHDRKSASPQQDVGIYVGGGTTNVVIEGCDVTGNATNGILVDGSTSAVTNIFIRDCNESGYSSYSTAIYVDGTGTNVSTVQITDCAGYNDQAPTLHSPAVVPPTGTFLQYYVWLLWPNLCLTFGETTRRWQSRFKAWPLTLSPVASL